MLGDQGLPAADHLDAVDAAVAAAERALRAEAAVVHDEARPGGAAQELDLVVEAEAAAVRAGAAGAFVQGVAAVEDRVLLLHDLDGRRLGDADGRAAVREAVVVGVAAVAAAGDLVHDEVAAALGVVAAEREVAGGAGGGGGDAVGDGGDEGGEDGLGDALADLGGAAGDRAGVVGVEEGALDAGDDERLEGAGRDRDLGEDVAHREVDRGEGGGADRVHRAGAGRGGAGEVEDQAVFLAGYG